MRFKLVCPRLALLPAAFFCLVTADIGCTSNTTASTQRRALSEVKLAIAKRDTRFVTVRGFTVSVPGIPDGAQNGLVLAHGKKSPIGVGDFIQNDGESQQQDTASTYAQTYNTFLLKYLLDNPDQKTKTFLKNVRQELKSLEHANAQSDALRAFNSSPKFLGVVGSREFGYPIEDSRTSHIEVRWLQMNVSVLRGAERKSFDRIVKTYVIPYNQILYKH